MDDSGLEYAFCRMESRFQSATAENQSKFQAFLLLQDLKRQLGWDHADQDAREFWNGLGASHRSVREKLGLARKLVEREASIQAFQQACQTSKTFNLSANSSYFDYRRLEASAWDGDLAVLDSIVDPSMLEGLSAKRTDVTKLTYAKIVEWLQLTKFDEIKFKDAPPEARRWLTTHEPRVQLRLVEEIQRRSLNLGRFWETMVERHASVPCVFAYVDYRYWKMEEEDRIQALAKAADKHLASEHYLEAIECYEKAILEQPSVSFHYGRVADICVKIQRKEWLDQAIKVLERGIARCKRRFDLALQLAGLCEENQEWLGFTRAQSVAIAALTRALQDKPDSTALKQRLAKWNSGLSRSAAANDFIN
jgi:hypothetical protein